MPKRSLKRFLNKVTCGDMRDLLPLLPPNSVDVVFTDPPWAREFLWAYEIIAMYASRILKPNGWAALYGGGMFLPQRVASTSRWLKWHWLLRRRCAEGSAVIRQYRLRATSADILLLRKGRPIVNGLLMADYGSKKDKALHDWQEGPQLARQVLPCLCNEGAVLLDPCTGSGTFPAVAKELGMDYVAFDVDPEACRIARARLRKVRRPAT